jgi:hypothetical protein
MKYCAVVLLALSSSEPEYMIGWYSGLNPKTLDNLPNCTLVMPYTGKSASNRERIKAYLDAAEAKGVKVFLEPLRDWIRQENWKELKDWVKAFKDHPAVYGWYAYDEPEVAQPPAGKDHIVPPERMAAAYRAIKEVDPKKPVAIVFNNLGVVPKYAPALDILMWDEYPATANGKEFVNMTFWTRRLQQSVDTVKQQGKQGLIVAVQGYGASHPEFGKRDPTFNELRYMFYASIVAETSLGVLFFMDSWAGEENKKNVEKLFKEAKEIGLAEIKKGTALPSDNPAIKFRRCGKTTIAVNTSNKPQPGVRLPSGKTKDFNLFEVHLDK